MQKTRSSSAKSGLLVEINQRSGLAGIYKAPRNLDQLGACQPYFDIKKSQPEIFTTKTRALLNQLLRKNSRMLCSIERA